MSVDEILLVEYCRMLHLHSVTVALFCFRLLVQCGMYVPGMQYHCTCVQKIQWASNDIHHTSYNTVL